MYSCWRLRPQCGGVERNCGCAGACTSKARATALQNVADQGLVRAYEPLHIRCERARFAPSRDARAKAAGRMRGTSSSSHFIGEGLGTQLASATEMPSVSPNVAVIGGGITGLAAAFYLRKLRPSAQITLFESGSRLGGNIRTERREQFVVDAGPDSFIRAKLPAMELCRELGLSGELIEPRAGAR